jgi:hypothetical protein
MGGLTTTDWIGGEAAYSEVAVGWPLEAKGTSSALFAFAGVLGNALLLGIAIWSFGRFYYFAFYVIEHYVDPGYRYAGIGSFLRYMMRHRKTGEKPP